MTGFAEEYRTDEPNAAIHLYSGPITFRSGDDTVSADGSIELRWLPTPDVCLEIPDFPDPELSIKVGDQPDFEVPHAIGSAAALMTATSVGTNRATSLKGLLNDTLEVGSGSGLRAVVFHLVNFAHFTSRRPSDAPGDWRRDRMTWQTGDWRLMIDAVPGLSELEKQVKIAGGYIISHTARLERVDGRIFTSQDAQQFWEGLFRFLSFVHGRRMSAILPIGYDSSGQPVWQEWAPWIIDPWKGLHSWADLHHGNHLADGFRGFMQRRADPSWKESIDRAIYWYVESNRNPLSIETNIILTQVALERLAWEYLVRQKVMSKSRAEDLKAKGRITRLLKDHKVPIDIPAHYSEMGKSSWADAVQAIVDVRNDIVHPEPKVHPTSALLREARVCGLWLLESFLLRLFEYNGPCSDRREPKRFVGKVETVPRAN